MICSNLKSGTAMSIVCDGRTWRIGSCNGGIAINANGSLCNCPDPGYTVRPCQGNNNPNWGGINTATCGGPSQTLEVSCE